MWDPGIYSKVSLLAKDVKCFSDQAVTENHIWSFSPWRPVSLGSLTSVQVNLRMCPLVHTGSCFMFQILKKENIFTFCSRRKPGGRGIPLCGGALISSRCRQLLTFYQMTDQKAPLPALRTKTGSSKEVAFMSLTNANTKPMVLWLKWQACPHSCSLRCESIWVHPFQRQTWPGKKMTRQVKNYSTCSSRSTSPLQWSCLELKWEWSELSPTQTSVKARWR